MIYKDKKICGIEIYDESKDNHVIASICDDKTELTNGYKIRVIPYIEEVKTND